MNPTQRSKIMDPRERAELNAPQEYSEVIETYDPATKINKAFFINPDGSIQAERHVVDLRIYHGANAPGDTCGLAPETAERFVKDQNASYWVPSPERMKENEGRWKLMQKEQMRSASVVTK